MAKPRIEDRPTADLRQTIRGTRSVQRTFLVIFAVIIAAWIVGGYWRQNVPVFISTLAMAVAIPAALHTSASAARAELQRRGESAE